MKRDKYINTAMNVNGGKSKKKLVVTLTVIILLLILISLIVTVLLTTGALENNKDKFFALIEKDFSAEEGFIDNRVIQYYENMQTTPYTNQGSLESNVEIASNNEVILSHPGDEGKFGAEFSGQTDKLNDAKESDITINYGKDSSWELKYKKVNGVAGVQSDYLTPKYIAAENERFESILKQVLKGDDESSNTENGANSSLNISDTLSNLFSSENLDGVNIDTTTLQTNLKTVKEQLSKDKFSKTESGEYVATLDSQDIINIINVLQLNIGVDTATIAQQNPTIEITASQDGVINAKVNVQVNNEESTGTLTLSFTISKQGSGEQELTYNVASQIAYEGENVPAANFSINLTLGYNGLDAMTEVSENHSLDITGNLGTGELSWNTQFNNNVTFTDSVDIAEFTDEDTLNLSNYPDEQVTPFIGQVKDRVNDINETLYKQSGLESKVSNLGLIVLGLLGNSSAEISNDGTATNVSDKLHETKTFEGLEFSGIGVTQKDGATIMTGTIKNASQDITLDQDLKITFVDEEGNEITSINVSVGGLGPGESSNLNIDLSEEMEGSNEIVNAYDYTISKE